MRPRGYELEATVGIRVLMTTVTVALLIVDPAAIGLPKIEDGSGDRPAL